MKRPIVLAVVVSVLASVVGAVSAGVVLEVEVVDHAEGLRSGLEVFRAQGETTRTDTAGAKGSTVIFRESSLFFVDHAKKRVQRIDKADVDALGRQLDQMAREMERLPPQQRAMMEKMMKGKAPGRRKPPELRLETGAETRVGEYACTVYTLYSDRDKVREVCMADESIGEDVFEAMDAFHALAEFSEQLMKVAENLPFGNLLEATVQRVPEAEGFPVRTRIFDGEGKMTLERTLKSIERRDLEPAVFEIPNDYKVKSLGKELQKGKKR